MSSAAREAPEVLATHRAGAGLMLALLGGEAMRRLRSALDEHALSPRQFQLLGLLHDRGPMRQTELGVEMEIAPSVAVTLLNPLEERGYVRRARDPRDRRRHSVSLTKRGADRLRSASRAQQEIEDDLLAALAPEQRTQLKGLLATVRDGLVDGNARCATTGSLEAPMPDAATARP